MPFAEEEHEKTNKKVTGGPTLLFSLFRQFEKVFQAFS